MKYHAYVLCLFLSVRLLLPFSEAVSQPAPEAPSITQRSAFVDEAFRSQRAPQYGEATRSFLALLEQEPRRAEEQRMLRRHVARFAALLPKEALALNFDGLNSDGEVTSLVGRLHERWTLQPGGGGRLAAWWRAQDPLPATPYNERLEEHLRRAAYADSAYADPNSLTGWDDRGLVYVRLGEPSLVRKVGFDGNCLSQAVMASPRVFSGDLPRNEVWRYGSAKEPALFVFTGFDGPYELVAPADLVPSHLMRLSGREEGSTTGPVVAGAQGGAGAASQPWVSDSRAGAMCGEWMGRGSKRQVLLLAMKELYDELARLDGRYLDAFVDLTEYIETPRDEKGLGAQLPPSLWAQSYLSKQKGHEERWLLRQERRLPRQQSNVLGDRTLLSVEAYLARFLEDDGTTRTEIYWTVPTQPLQAAELLTSLLHQGRLSARDRYLVRTTAVQRTPEYQARQAHLNQLILRLPEEREAGGFVPVQQLAVRGDTGRYHVALQWDFYPLVGEGEATRLSTEAPFGTAVFRADSLGALNADAARLEMSDLVPVLASSVPLQEPSLQEATPYPLRELPAGVDIGLYFQIYHLAFDAEDKTRYTVEYEVRRREKAGLLKVFGRTRDAKTAGRAGYEGAARRADEMIVLDLDDWDGEDELVVTVRVTDEVLQQTISRELSFAAVKEAE